jgi:Alginate export
MTSTVTTPLDRLGAGVGVLFSLASVLCGQSPPQSQQPEPAPSTAKSGVASAAKADEPKPWRLNQAIGGPSWFKVSGEQRARYESLHNQYRFRNATASPPVRGFGDDEDVLALRTSLLMEAQGEQFGGAIEILDARQHWVEDSDIVDTTMVNVYDVLQAYADIHLGSFGGSGKHTLRVGREAIDLGNRRLIARNAYRNTINAFTGASWLWAGEKDRARVLWSLPVDRRPGDFDGLQDNEFEWDDQDVDLQFGAVFYDHKLDERSNLEFYLFWLDESGRQTRQRELYTPGIRWNRSRKKGDFQFEIELVGQFGESKVNTSAASPQLDHLAGFGTIAGGYLFDMAWTPSLIASLTYATGDQDPNDRDNERFDTLFGARRFEYGPTGIWGTIARANVNTPELRLLLQPSKTFDLMFAVRGVWLASERDAWTPAGLRDRTGQSGDNIGTQYECRARWDIVPKNFNLEVGAAYLAEGSFQDRASGNQGRDVSYAYVQTTITF